MDQNTLNKSHLYEEENFPFVMFSITKEQCFPDGPGYRYLHWHDDLQFTLVTKGTLNIQVNSTTYTLKEGEAIFINCGLLHMTTYLSDTGKYISFNFPTKLLSVFGGSQLERDYVLPFTTNYSFPTMLLTRDHHWQVPLLDNLQKLVQLSKHLEYYPNRYEIIITLMQIWLSIVAKEKDTLGSQSKTYIKKQGYLHEMLSYIHLEYNNEITIKSLADYAHISVGECYRCFKHILHTSPYEYLLNYRIGKSCELLFTTQLSISEVATMCGFNDSSHFIQYFKRKMQLTPNAYRTQKCTPL